MKEQYQKEVSQIHVPKELLEKTKRAMKEEEGNLAKQKKAGKRIPFRTLSMAAAAAILLLVMIPAGMLFFSGRSQSERDRQVQLQLKNHADPEIVKIGQGSGKAFTVKEADRMPEQFEGAEEIVMDDIAVFVTADEETGYLEAYYEKDGKAYIVTSRLTDLGEFEEAFGKELK